MLHNAAISQNIVSSMGWIRPECTRALTPLKSFTVVRVTRSGSGPDRSINPVRKASRQEWGSRWRG